MLGTRALMAFARAQYAIEPFGPYGMLARIALISRAR
jgi:hypothetical protein